MKRILLVKTSSLGDVIHNLPVVNDILQHYPEAIIDWVVDESFADIPRLHPQVNQIITVALRRWRKQLFRRKTWCEICHVIRRLSTNQYDAVIDTQGLIKSGIITSLTKGITHGYDRQSIREPLASWCYQQKHHISYQQHAVSRNRSLAALSLNYAIPNHAPDYGIKASACTDIVINQPYIIGLHGTSRASKLWSTDNWVALGKTLTQKNLNLVLPWANDAEFKRANEIANQLQNATVLPKLNIAELASVIANAQAAIGVDTGLSHLAVALSKPTIAIYTDTDPALTGVMAGNIVPAVNLGGKGQLPSVDAAFQHALINMI